VKGRQNNRVADSIYYSLYHDKNVTVNTLLYAQLLYKLFHWKILLCLEKERLNIPTMLVDFFIGARALSANSVTIFVTVFAIYFVDRYKFTSYKLVSR
jgi:hypothetical protein